MSTYLLGLALALLASVALNVSYLVQHSASAHGLPAIDMRRPLRTLRSLFGSRLWLAGGALGLAGWGLHIAALTKAPLSMVQAFLVGGIVLLVPVAVRVLNHRLQPSEIAGVGLIVVGLVALTVGRGHIGSHSHFTTGPLLAYLLGASLLALVVLRLLGRRRAQALGLAGGILYGAADVSIKALTGIGSQQGIVDVLTSAWLIPAILASVIAFFAFQRGLQSGKAMPVIALMTAGTNIVSIIGGLVVFGDPLGRSGGTVALHLAAFVLVAVASWLLAPAQAVVTTGGETEEQPARGKAKTRALPGAVHG